MRTLAIDLGTKRVGLAMSDEGGKLATPIQVLTVSDSTAALAPILQIIRDELVTRIVVGLPLNMDGTLGASARSSIKWGKSLELEAGIPVLYIDERLSSFDAEQQLIGRKRAGEKLTHKAKKQQRDAIAAASFLQDFLDGKLTPIDIDSACR